MDTRIQRRALIGGAVALALTGPAFADADPWDVLRAGAIVLFRHANAPGVGDPPGMRIDDCATQRNLDVVGRDQARAIGREFAARGIDVGRVLTSRWCRAVETAELAFPGRSVREPAFDSFFDRREDRLRQTAAALRVLEEWRGPGALVVVTHQVNIAALTGVSPASAEGVVTVFDTSALRQAGRIRIE
jgi:phosphohistidine phosphatase SixA